MKLKDYIIEKRLLQKDFCKLLGVKKSFISLIVNGKYIPDAKKIYDIHKFTNGEVTFIDFVTDDNGNEIGGLKNGIVKK